MAPAQMELFRFGVYVFFPIAMFVYFGDPDYFDRHVKPLVSAYKREDKVQVAPPQTTTELKSELARLRDERLSKRAERLEEEKRI